MYYFTCDITDFSLCTWNTVITADRSSFFHSLPSAREAALTARGHGQLWQNKLSYKTPNNHDWNWIVEFDIFSDRFTSM